MPSLREIKKHHALEQESPDFKWPRSLRCGGILAVRPPVRGGGNKAGTLASKSSEWLTLAAWKASRAT